MATFTLTAATGVQNLSSGTTRLFIQISNLGHLAQSGRATPVNRYDAALVRLGNSGFYYPAVPIDADQQVIDIPSGVTEFGYSLLAGTQLVVTENGPPVGGGTPAVHTDVGGTAVYGQTITITWSGLSDPLTDDNIGCAPEGFPIGGTHDVFTATQGVYTSSCTATQGTVALGSGSCSGVLVNTGDGPVTVIPGWVRATGGVIATGPSFSITG